MSLQFLTMCLRATDTLLVPISVLQEQLGNSKLVEYFAFSSGGSSLLPIRPNQKEREYFKDHPINSARGAFAAMGARLRAEKEYPPDTLLDGEGDAVRHCYWSAQLYRDLDESSATEILENHESGSIDPTGYDPHNNAVGRTVGLGSNLSNDELWNQCQAKASDGTLRYDGSPIHDDDDDDDDDDDQGS